MLLDNGVREVTIVSTSPYPIPSAFIMYTSPSMVDERLCLRTSRGIKEVDDDASSWPRTTQSIRCHFYHS